MCKRCPPNLIERLRNHNAAPVDFGDLGEVRKLLTFERDLSDEEVAYIRDLIVRFADAVFDNWLRKRNAALAESVREEDNSDERNPPPSSP